MTSRRILVTGGAGFIGGAVVRRLVGKGHRVVNLDKLTYSGNLASLEPVADALGKTDYATYLRRRAAEVEHV